ncbi:hypothetical protein XH80_24120 [Bradyrhizobium sp. CCBAU 45384]|nr:hypothetical protein [Bradyrhizobium sp. CCBAU 45384]
MMKRVDILKYAKSKYETEAEYPWENFPRYAVLKHENNMKWYGLIMNVPRERLGLKGDGEIDIIDIKTDPYLVDALRNARGYLPAYHMNKEHWISVLLDGSVSKQQVQKLIDSSFDLTK